jgi:hypothetical protein
MTIEHPLALLATVLSATLLGWAAFYGRWSIHVTLDMAMRDNRLISGIGGMATRYLKPRTRVLAFTLLLVALYIGGRYQGWII